MKKDDERLFNFLLYKIYATNDEMTRAGPFTLGVVFLLGMCFFIWWLVS